MPKKTSKMEIVYLPNPNKTSPKEKSPTKDIPENVDVIVVEKKVSTPVKKPEVPKINKIVYSLPLNIGNTYTLVGHTWHILELDDYEIKATRSPHGVVHLLARSDFESWIEDLK